MDGWEFVDNPPFALAWASDSKPTQLLWEQVKQRLPSGFVLSGPVFARTHFGVFYDAGVGFPVRINVTDFGKPEGGMLFPDDYPALGSIMQGELSAFEDSRQQIVTVKNYRRWRGLPEDAEPI